MRKAMITAVAASLLSAYIPSARADDRGPEVVKWQMLNGIKKAEQEFRNKECPQLAPDVGAACLAAYDMAIARQRASVAEIDFIIKARAVKDSVLSERLYTLLSFDEHRRDIAVTRARGEEIHRIFGEGGP